MPEYRKQHTPACVRAACAWEAWAHDALARGWGGCCDACDEEIENELGPPPPVHVRGQCDCPYEAFPMPRRAGALPPDWHRYVYEEFELA